MKRDPYRNPYFEFIIIDFSAYYEDALAIGFSNSRAAEYALKCCKEEIEKIKSLQSCERTYTI